MNATSHMEVLPGKSVHGEPRVAIRNTYFASAVAPAALFAEGAPPKDDLNLVFQVRQQAGTLPRQIALQAFEAATGKLHFAVTAPADAFTPAGHLGLGILKTRGHSTDKDTLRAYSLRNGEFLFPFGGETGTDFPLTLNSYGRMRFLAFRSVDWVQQDVPDLPPLDGLRPAGVLSYSSPSANLQKIALYFDGSVWNDPADNPDSFTISGHGLDWTVGPNQSESARIFAANAAKGSADPTVIFDGLSVKIVFWKTEEITIPLEKDRLVLEKAVLKTKAIRKLVDVSAKPWSELLRESR